MAMQNPADHKLIVNHLNFNGMDGAQLSQAMTLELDKMVREAKALGHVIVTHTVTQFPDIDTVVLTLQTFKA